MKKLFYLLALLLLSACSSTQKILHTNSSECSINEVVQPDWICSKHILVEDSFTAVGTSDMGSSKIDNLRVEQIKNRAILAGKKRLTRVLENMLRIQFYKFKHKVGIQSDEEIDNAFLEVSKQLSKIVELRLKLIKYRQVNNRLYVLVGISKSTLEKNLQQIIKMKLKKEPQLWKQFKFIVE